MSTSKKTIKKDPLAQQINHLLGGILDGNYEQALKNFANQSPQQYAAYQWICGFIAAKPKKRHSYPQMRKHLLRLVGVEGDFSSDTPFIDGSSEKLDEQSTELAIQLLQAFGKKS